MSTTISAFWGDHEITRVHAATAVSGVLARIAELDGLLAGWRAQGESLESAMKKPQFDVTPEALASSLEQIRTDFGDEAIPDLGFRFSGWNGAQIEKDQASVNVTIGAHTGNPNLGNAFVLNLPDAWSPTDGRVDALIDVLVGHLAPDEVVSFDGDERQVRWTRGG